MKFKFAFTVFCILSLFCSAAAGNAINVGSSLCRENISDIGQTYSDAVKIFNKEKKPVEIKLYQTDYLYYPEGTNRFGEPGKDVRSNAAWVTRLPRQVTIPPEETLLVHYEVTVPHDRSLSGSYWSMIMVEEIDQGGMEMMASGERQMGIRQMTRYGIQVVTHIGNTGSRQLEFKSLKLINGKEKRLLRIDLSNSGTRALRPLLWVDFYAESGGYSKKINGNQRHIFPECGVSQQLDLTDIPPGKYKAVVVADAGDETVFGTSFSVQLEK